MQEILDEMFLHEQEAHRPDCTHDFYYQNLEYRLKAYHSKVEKNLGPAFLDDMLGLESEQRLLTSRACFRHGFHLAVRLLLA